MDITEHLTLAARVAFWIEWEASVRVWRRMSVQP